MKCADAREVILEADPSDLRGEGTGILVRHLRDCGGCRALARAVLEEQRLLAAEMVAAVPPPDVNEILDRALCPQQVTGPIRRFRRSRRFKRMGLALIPLAAAAAAAALLLGTDPPLPGPSYSPPERIAALGLEVPEGQNAAVLQTKNPEITVLWFF